MIASDAEGEPDRLVALYRELIGEPDSRTDVYLGFAVFFAGLGLGLVGLLLFVLERGAIDGEVFWVREIAFAAGALGLPLVLVSVVVLLPADRRATYVAAAGLLITVAAIALFVAVYPSNWNHGTPDYSLQGVTVYAIGLVSVLAATGSALVGYHVERAAGGPRPAAEQSAEDDEPAVTDEQVRRDIDDAMAGTEVSWGGVEKVDTERLTINPSAELEGENLDRASAKVHRSASVDEQLSALKGLKGGEQRTDRTDGVEDQTAALRELREQQQAADDAEPIGLADRLRAFVGR